MTTAYDQLRDTFTRLSRLSHLSAITGWDMQTQMPSGRLAPKPYLNSVFSCTKR